MGQQTGSRINPVRGSPSRTGGGDQEMWEIPAAMQSHSSKVGLLSWSARGWASAVHVGGCIYWSLFC